MQVILELMELVAMVHPFDGLSKSNWAISKPRAMVAMWTKKSRQLLAAWWAGCTSSIGVVLLGR